MANDAQETTQSTGPDQVLSVFDALRPAAARGAAGKAAQRALIAQASGDGSLADGQAPSGAPTPAQRDHAAALMREGVDADLATREAMFGVAQPQPQLIPVSPSDGYSRFSHHHEYMATLSDAEVVEYVAKLKGSDSKQGGRDRTDATHPVAIARLAEGAQVAKYQEVYMETGSHRAAMTAAEETPTGPAPSVRSEPSTGSGLGCDYDAWLATYDEGRRFLALGGEAAKAVMRDTLKTTDIGSAVAKAMKSLDRS